MAILLARQTSPANRIIPGVRFVENAPDEYDHGLIAGSLPASFGDAEFTLSLVLRPDNTFPFGPADGSTELTEWSNVDNVPYSASDWWFRGNFCLDGFRLGSQFYNGTFALQFYGSGNVRWLFGDGTAPGAAQDQTGLVWTVQRPVSLAEPGIVDGNRHHLHLIRRWQSTPANSADLELWVDGVLYGVTNTPVRTQMWTSFWNPTPDGGWFFGTEKQVALGSSIQYEDYKGTVGEVAFYDGAMSPAELANTFSAAVNSSHPNYLDHIDFTEQTGTAAVSNNALMTMNLFSQPGVPGAIWVPDV